MLTELHIENLGVIERADVVFGPGMTAITGETGAGKTLVVEALALVVGGRADPLVVRHGASEARVDGRFVLGSGSDEREVVLSRVVAAEGRSRAYVDGRPTTAAALAEVAAELVDLHGQHAHQRLLSTAHQRQALDEFAGIDLTPLNQARARVVELDAELAALGGDERSRARELDLLRYQLGELDAAALADPDEESSLAVLEDTLADAVEHQVAGSSAYLALTADDAGARAALTTALAALEGRSPYTAATTRLTGLLAELDDLAATVHADAEQIEPDPERLAATRSRRQQLRDLCRKYGDDLGAVIEFADESARRLAELESFDERAADLDLRRLDAVTTAEAAAAAVLTARRAAAPALSAAVTARLVMLAMPAAVVEIAVGADSPADPGDHVQFLIAANPGTAPLPLAKIASGGELARTMLAVRLALAEAGAASERRASTAVFDEVDAGIGGGAAVDVGSALAEIATTTQVIVVTHLAQVAAAADHQISVDKRVAGGVTSTVVDPVGGDDRVAEVARMLAGSTDSAAHEHARQLLTARRGPR